MNLAISRGYYSIPRKVTTAELGDDLGISDQGVVERLRRATVTLARDRLRSAASTTGRTPGASARQRV